MSFYEGRRIEYNVVKWTGENRSEVDAFLRDRFPSGLSVVEQDEARGRLVLGRDRPRLRIGPNEWLACDPDGVTTTHSPERFGYLFESPRIGDGTQKTWSRQLHVQALCWLGVNKADVFEFTLSNLGNLDAEFLEHDRLQAMRQGAGSILIVPARRFVVMDGDGWLSGVPLDKFGFYYRPRP